MEVAESERCRLASSQRPHRLMPQKHGVQPIESWLARPRLEAMLLGPGWRFSALTVMIVGGLGGIWPVAALGASGSGVFAAFVNGCTATATASLIWLPPIAFLCIGRDTELGVRAIEISLGLGPRGLQARGWWNLYGLAFAAMLVGGFAGVVGGVVTNVSAPGRFSVGLVGSVGAAQSGAALSALIVVALLCGSLVEILGDRRSSLIAIWGTQLLTLALLSVLYFAPTLSFAQYLSPWIGIWPLRASSSMSPLFASQLSYGAGGVALAIWIVAIRIVAAIMTPRRVSLPSSNERQE